MFLSPEGTCCLSNACCQLQIANEDGTLGWGFNGVKYKGGRYQVIAKGWKPGSKLLYEKLGHSDSAVIAALMYDAALEQRGVLNGYNFSACQEREQVGKRCNANKQAEPASIQVSYLSQKHPRA